jgi:hypothetical protein
MILCCTALRQVAQRNVCAVQLKQGQAKAKATYPTLTYPEKEEDVAFQGCPAQQWGAMVLVNWLVAGDD